MALCRSRRRVDRRFCKLHDILKIKGIKGTILSAEVPGLQTSSGYKHKHIEVIIVMMRKIKIEDSGDTNMLPGGPVDMFEFEKENNKVIEMT